MQLKPDVTADDHIQGDAAAAVTLVEYGDYQCPHCAMAHPVVRNLQKKFGSSLRFVFRNFPLTEIHPLAEPAAESTEFAAVHGKYWEFHHGIFAHQSRLSPEMLVGLAEQNALDAEALSTALDDGEFEPRVKRDFASGVRSGVNGTPTFFINGRRHDGAPDFASLSASIEAAKSAGG